MLEDSRRLSGISKLISPVAPLYNSLMSRFRVGDLVRVSKADVLRPAEAGIVHDTVTGMLTHMSHSEPRIRWICTPPK